MLKGKVKVRMRSRTEAAGAAPVEVLKTGLVAPDDLPRPGDTFAMVADLADPRVWAFAEGTPDLGTGSGLRRG